MAIKVNSSVIRPGDTSKSNFDDVERVNMNTVNIDHLAEMAGKKSIAAGSYHLSRPNIASIDQLSISTDSVVSNAIYSGVIQQDAGCSFLHHNHLEQQSTIAPFAPITSGNTPPAPLYAGAKQSGINVLGHWYQDSGTEYRRVSGTGWEGWYYWSWLFHGAAGDGYQSKRHPWLGYYRGDDANVLDWQCYWLNEAGVTGVIPTSTAGTILSTWSAPAAGNYWLYQLFNNVPNFKQLTYALWAHSASSANTTENKTLIEASFTELVSIYTQYRNCATVTINGGVYPIVYSFTAEQWRGAYDSFNGETNTRAFLAAQAAKFKAAGFAGVCILARLGTGTFFGDPALEAAGVIYLNASYEAVQYEPSFNSGLATAATYSDLANGACVITNASTNPPKYTVANVATDLHSHSAHTSSFNIQGSTPELFGKMVSNILKRGKAIGSPDILTIYNIGEWAEGGACLQPNMRDGKGYLNALAEALKQRPQDFTRVPSALQKTQRQAVVFLSGPGVKVPVAQNVNTIPLSVSYAWASTALPFINDPLAYNGKRLRIIHDQSSAHPGPITLQDNATLVGSGLKLVAASIALGKNDSVEFEYDSALALWVQSGNVVNVL